MKLHELIEYLRQFDADLDVVITDGKVCAPIESIRRAQSRSGRQVVRIDIDSYNIISTASEALKDALRAAVDDALGTMPYTAKEAILKEVEDALEEALPSEG